MNWSINCLKYIVHGLQMLQFATFCCFWVHGLQMQQLHHSRLNSNIIWSETNFPSTLPSCRRNHQIMELQNCWLHKVAWICHCWVRNIFEWVFFEIARVTNWNRTKLLLFGLRKSKPNRANITTIHCDNISYKVVQKWKTLWCMEWIYT